MVSDERGKHCWGNRGSIRRTEEKAREGIKGKRTKGIWRGKEETKINRQKIKPSVFMVNDSLYNF
jgi:hypothetical protein